MTSPITPLPSIHNDIFNRQQALAQLRAELQLIEGLLSQLSEVILISVINAILRALGLGNFVGPVDHLLTNFQSEFQNLIVNKLQGLIDSIANGLGHGGVNHLVSDIETFLTQFPGENIVGRVDNALFNGFNIFGHIPLSRIPFIPASHIVNSQPELLWNSGFDTSASVNPNGGFTWDGSTGHTNLGSAKATPGGVLCNMISSPIPVTLDETLNLSAWTQWSGLTTSGSSPAPIRMEVWQYLSGAKVASTALASLATPGSFSAWTQLTGTFNVPGGVDTVYLTLIVDTTATGGSVWFDDASVYKAGTLAAGNTLHKAWENLLTRLFGANSIEAKLLGTVLPDITRALSSDLQGLIDAVCNALGIPNTGHSITTALTALENIPAAVVKGATQWDQALWGAFSQAINGISAFENNIQGVIWNDIGYAEGQIVNWVEGFVPRAVRSFF